MKKVINITGMRCNHCTSSVEKALCGVPGVSDVQVELAAGTATLEAADGVSDETLKKTVDDLGFQVTAIR